MIKSLSIKNYALIERLEMTPSPNLNIITGETGAGKSIMLGAVGLLLGKRADTKSLFSDKEKCVVEGIFDIQSFHLKQLFEDAGLDFDTECIIRREISPTGKSRAFINDTPVTLDVLKSLGVHLMDIHSQHETLNLGDNTYQLEMLDHYAGHTELLSAYQDAYQQFAKAQAHYQQLSRQAQKNNKDLDYKQFLFNELEALNLSKGELSELEEELELLENAEAIKGNLTQLTQLLDESDYSLINQMKESMQLLASIKGFSKTLEVLFERVDSASIELQDISRDVANEQDRVELDPERLQLVKDRVDLIFKQQQKHQVTNADELIGIKENLERELQSVINIDEEITTAKSALDQCKETMLKAGAALTKSRTKHAKPLAASIISLIKQVGIENGNIEIKTSPFEPSENGLDLIEMLFSANKGVEPRELKTVASGGEFSRLIFAIKYLLADKKAMPTIIFDEIDTGVSGEVALQMVHMMKEMAQKHQVISISHLPQFAAGGDSHYFVYKDHSADKSVSKVKKLDGEDRILAIAQMIGGEQPGESAIQSAKELLLKP